VLHQKIDLSDSILVRNCTTEAKKYTIEINILLVFLDLAT
jgi:hypothetical protein